MSTPRKGQETTLKGSDCDLKAYVSRPAKTGRYPAVIVIHEIFGLVDHTRDIADRFAQQGYLAVAPNLMSRPELAAVMTPAAVSEMFGLMSTMDSSKSRDPAQVEAELAKLPTDRADRIRKVMRLMFGGLPYDKMTADLVQVAKHVRSLSEVTKLGSVGFCFGGGMSIKLACATPIDGCVIFYGQNPEPVDLVEHVAGPVLGIYGGEDARINAGLKDLVDAMVRYKKDFEMRIYPGAPHAFFNDTSKATYRPEAAAEAWQRVLNFYRRTLQ
ncbi:MAG: dienelactone hydrolase family protein [Candidatus Marsarchaeota archaeon]|nr:dienelactone hydrolase family protein [Candidatus Marsarchaeota archaeon]